MALYRRKAKWFASIMMLISGLIMLLTNAPFLVKLFTNTTMLLVRNMVMVTFRTKYWNR